MTEPITDIVMLTRNRLEYLNQSVTHIHSRTRSPHKLHVIDDASTDGNVEWLAKAQQSGIVETLVLRGDRHGALTNLNIAVAMTYSDPIVLTDDDILCPDIDPDWLQRGREAILARPRLGILALNHPGARRVAEPEFQHEGDGEVTYCRCVGYTLVFVRRKLLVERPLPHYRENFGTTPAMIRCSYARLDGWEIGYLTNVYCRHIGVESSLTGKAYNPRSFEIEQDSTTLEPLEERWRG